MPATALAYALAAGWGPGDEVVVSRLDHDANVRPWLQVAARAANGLTLMLLGISLLVLIVSGVGIMNIMLANVRTRIREIGIRKAIGATSREIRLQFLTEAVLISLTGGVVGTILGLGFPDSPRSLRLLLLC